MAAIFTAGSVLPRVQIYMTKDKEALVNPAKEQKDVLYCLFQDNGAHLPLHLHGKRGFFRTFG